MTAIRSAAALVAVLALTASCTEGPTNPTVALKPQFNLNGGPEGLIHLWSGDGNANDAVGTAHGTLGTTGFGAGINGQAFSFDGAQDAIVTLPVGIGPASLPQMTMGMWVMLRSVVNEQGWVLGHDDGGYDRSLALTDARYWYGVAGGTGAVYRSTLPRLRLAQNLNRWHCVAVAYDAVAETATFYADGATQKVPATPGEGLPDATLGGLALHPNHTVDALVDEVFMYDRALSGAEIARACDATSLPVITRFVIERATLWPVNNKLVTVASGITAIEFGYAAVNLNVVVTANEAITSADWAMIRNNDGSVDVQVRAARAGTGAGRVYTITATATDGAGNSSSMTGTVTVPHDQGTRAGK